MNVVYTDYDASNADRLGALPSHWVASALKHHFRVIGGTTPKSGEEGFWDGDVVWITPADLSKLDDPVITRSLRTITREGLASCGATMVPQGSIILSTRAPIGSLALAGDELCTNQGCKALVPFDTIETKYFYYLLSVSTEALNVRGRGTTFRELSGDELAAFKTPVPPLPEQRAIAAFLDRETGKIDALVEEQRRLIALLKGKRQAVITHAVTKGLDPTAPLKPSGIDWLGDIPAHWEVVQVRRIVRQFEQGWSPECFSRPAEPGEWGVLKTGCVNGGFYREQENKALPPETPPEPELQVRKGDVLMSRASGSPDLIGSVARVNETAGRIMLSDKIFRLRLEPHADPGFVVWAFASDPVRDQIIRAISGAEGMANNLPQSKLKAFAFVLPPPEEQARIVSWLKQRILQIDDLIREAETAIDLLQERRSALISAAVTGKIDVRPLVPEATEAA